MRAGSNLKRPQGSGNGRRCRSRGGQAAAETSPTQAGGQQGRSGRCQAGASPACACGPARHAHVGPALAVKLVEALVLQGLRL